MSRSRITVFRIALDASTIVVLVIRLAPAQVTVARVALDQLGDLDTRVVAIAALLVRGQDIVLAGSNERGDDVLGEV